jgi:hypothetical protein
MERVEQVGPNEIVKQKQISFFKLAKEELTEPLILLLFAVGFFYAIWGDNGDALTIFAVITIVIFVEVWNEYRAKKTISSLSKMVAPKATVLREGKITEVVPEDILVLIPGTRIAADNFLVKLYQPMVTYKLMSHLQLVNRFLKKRELAMTGMQGYWLSQVKAKHKPSSREKIPSLVRYQFLLERSENQRLRYR